MDFLASIRTLEQFAYELMSWVFFYPLTIIRVILNPRAMTQYVLDEIAKPENDSFATGMRPALFLLISLTFGVFLVPLTSAEIAEVAQSKFGKAITDSWVALLTFRMIAFTVYPMTGAIILDRWTPGEVTRQSLRIPFSQQCYIFAPFALIVSPCLVLSARGEVWASILLALAFVWALVAEILFFRDQAKFGWPACVAAAVFTLLVGFSGGMVFFLLMP